jgi:hypothetical protein
MQATSKPTSDPENWRELCAKVIDDKVRLLDKYQDPDMRAFRVRESSAIFWGRARPGEEAKLIHSQSFEGTVVEVSETHVTIEFEVNGCQEIRRFPHAQPQAAALKVSDVLELHCELKLVPPVAPRSLSEVEDWEHIYADYVDSQGTVTRARFLEGEG